MDGCTKGPQLEEGENLNTEEPETRRTPPGGNSVHVGQGQEKVTHLKHFNEESSGAGSENSQMSPSAKEVKGVAYASVVQDVSPDPEWFGKEWFDSLDPKSVDGFEELSNKFLEEFSQQKRYDKNPTEIHGIKQKPDEWLQAFMDRFKAESAHIKGVPPLIRCGRESRLSSKERRLQTPPKSSDRLSGKRTLVKLVGRRTIMGLEIEVIERGQGKIMRTCAPHDRREGFTPLIKTPKEILAMDNVNFPLPPSMVGTLEKRNMNKFCDYHQDQGHNTNNCYHLKKHIEEAATLGILAHLVKDIRQSGQKNKGSAKGKEKVINMVSPQGYRKRHYKRVDHWMDNAITFSVRRIYIDGGISLEIMYEHCFRNLSYQTRSRLRESRNPLVGFSGEVNYPLGVIDLKVTIEECRTGMRSLGVVAFTIHSMIKLLTSNGIATIATTRETLKECRQIEEAQALSQHTHLDDVEERRQSNQGINPPKSSVEEKIVVNDNYPAQLVTVGGGLSTECRHALIHTLRRNVDIFAWTPADMTGIPRAITKHILDTYPHIKPKVQKKRSLALDRRKVVTDEVNEWLKAGIRLVDYAFKEQIRVNLEAYVDDMVIKSRTKQDIIKDIEQTFSTLRRINMKLNPKKCSFDMEEGKLLGYIVTSEGIRVNPKKTKAVMDMPSPKTLKQMQSLSGKLTALNHFLSKSAKRSLPFLDTLKKCTNKKDFRWTEVVEATFLEMKKLVSELPTLTTPKKGETLTMYLAAKDEAVSAVPLTERDGRKMPIHNVNRSLLSNRHFNEDKCCPVVDSTQRVEDIPKSSNAREDLTPGPRVLRLYTDGALNNRGSGASHILIRRCGILLHSKLVASQVEGSYEAKDHLSKKVLVKVLNERSVEAQEVNMVVEEEGPTLMTPIRNYLEKGMLPEDPVDVRNELLLNLDLLEEQREIAAIREAIYKQLVEKYYNKKVRHVQFKVGEFVLRKNKASRDANT
nr:reverse transcriptase domain-containing protein [Tanacetum cinerariifolium]